MGLLGMAARTAVVAGTATHVAGNVQRRQQRRWAREGRVAAAGTGAAASSRATRRSSRATPRSRPPPHLPRAPRSPRATTWCPSCSGWGTCTRRAPSPTRSSPRPRPSCSADEVGSARAGTGGRPSRKELSARLEHVRARAEATTAGRLQRRAMELDLMHQAMVLAALTMTLLIPALITLAALIPLGEPHGAAALVARRLGLSAQATRDLQSLFGGTSVERSSTTWVGATRHAVVRLRLADRAAEGLRAGLAAALAGPAWHLAAPGVARRRPRGGGGAGGRGRPRPGRLASAGAPAGPRRVRLGLVDPAPAARRSGRLAAAARRCRSP